MNYELQGTNERLYYAFLCIAWRQSTDHSRRVHIWSRRAHIAQQRNRQIANEK